MKVYGIIFLFLVTSFVSPAADYERFEENGKVGIRDNSGQVVLPAAFDALGWSDGTFSVTGQITGYRQQGRWGLLNLKKEFITQAAFDQLTYPGGDRVVVSKFINTFTRKTGCLDLSGRQVIPLTYDAITIYGLRAIVMIKNGTRYEHGLTDLNDRQVLPVLYKQILPIGSLRYAVEDFSGKFALCSEEGKWVTDFVIDHIGDFTFDLAVIQQGWRQGIIDRNGDIKVQALYRDVKITAPGEVMARRADKWEVLDAAFLEVASLEADTISFFHGGPGRFSVDGRYGLVDEQLKVRWQPKFEYLGGVENGQVVAKQNGKYGLLRLDQSPIIPFSFDSVCAHGNYVRALQEAAGKSSWVLYDTFGIRKTTSSYEFLAPFNGKFFEARNHGYLGGVDRYGKERIACVYDSLVATGTDLIAVRFQGQYGIITSDDHWRLGPQKNPIKLLNDECFLEQRDSLHYLRDIFGNDLYFTANQIEAFPDHLLERLPDGTEKEINFHGQIVSRIEPAIRRNEQSFPESEGLTGIQRDGKFGFVDRQGRLRIANRYEAILQFQDGMAAVKLLGKWGFINASDQIVIQPTFESVENFSGGTAIVSRKGKVGLINSSGKEILAMRYDSIRRLTNGLFILTLQGHKGLANTAGEVQIEPRFDQLICQHNGTVIVSRDGKFGVVTPHGLSTLPLQYDALTYDPSRNEYLCHKKSEWARIEL